MANLPAYATDPLYNPTTPITTLTGGLTELVALLNTASTTGDTTNINGYWKPNAITWSLANGIITFRGNNAGFFYTPAGFLDPTVIQTRTYTATSPSPNGKFYPRFTLPSLDPLNYTRRPNLFVRGYTMNQRLGYALSGLSQGQFFNSFAPGNVLYANNFNITFPSGINIPADTQPNISGTSIVSIYGSFSGMGGNSTAGNRLNLLSVVPLEGVVGYTNFTGVGLKAPLYKVVPDVYAIDIELRDDNDQPFVVPDSANVNLEIGFKYRNTNKPQPSLYG
jgi:hypothetical protein